MIGHPADTDSAITHFYNMFFLLFLFSLKYFFTKSVLFGAESEIEVFICKKKVVASPQNSGKLANKM